MVWSRKRLHCLFLALIVWESANGLGVWQKRPATYWQSGDQALSSPVQQDFGSTASRIQTAVYDVGSAQPLSTSGSGGSAANVPGFLRQYTSSSDQNVLNQYSSLPQSQGGYTAQSSGTSGGITWLSQSTSNQAAAGFLNQPLSSPVSSAQGSSSQLLPSQQSSLQLASPGLVVSSPPLSSTTNVPGTQTQSSSPLTSSLSTASATTPLQASYGSQSATGTLLGQPSSFSSSTQGQGAQTSFQPQAMPYKPVSQYQGPASQSLASQQSRFQLLFPSQGISLPAYVPGTQSYVQAQPSSTVTSSQTLATVSTSKQASYGSQSATGTFFGQPSSLSSSTQGETVQIPSQFADSPYKPVVNIVDAYTAGPAQWYTVDPFRQTGQANQPLFPSQASGSLGSQAAQSSYPSTAQTQSTPGSFGLGFQSQSAPASTVSLTQSAVQVPSFQTSSGFATASFSATSPSASGSQSFQGVPSSATWSSSGVSTSPVQSTSSQVPPVATSQQYSRDASQSTSFSATQAIPGSPSQSAAQVPFQTTSRFSTTSLTAASPSGLLSPDNQVVSSSYPSTSQTQSIPGSFGIGFQSQIAPASTVSLTASAAQLPFQTPSGFSTTSISAASPSASVFQPTQGAQSTVTWTSPIVSTSPVQSTFGQVPPVATTQQYSRDASQSTSYFATLPSQGSSTAQASGNYGSAFQSTATQVGSFDQYSPVSSSLSRTSTSDQGTTTNFGLVQGFSSQGFGEPQSAAGSFLNQPPSDVQGSSSVSGDFVSLSSFERSGSTSYSFDQDLNKPVFRPAAWRTQDQSSFSVKH